jgi:hypothetical protein
MDLVRNNSDIVVARSSRLTLIAYLGLALAGRTRDLIMSRRVPRDSLSLFILVVLVIIAESNPILHAPQQISTSTGQKLLNLLLFFD